MGCRGIIVKDTLILSIDSKVLNNLKLSNKFKILRIGFTINDSAINEDSFKKTMYALGYPKHFEVLNSLSNLNSIMSSGDPVKFVYKIHKEKLSDIRTLRVKFKY